MHVRTLAHVPDSGGELPRDEYLARLGVVLREARKAADYTQIEMAEWIGVNAGTFTRWEDGRNGISAYDLARLINRYGIDPDLALNPPASLVEVRRRLSEMAERAADAVRKGLTQPHETDAEPS